MDKSSLARWRALDAARCLVALADHAKEDRSFKPRTSSETTRWHASVAGRDFEILCTGPKFWDTRSNQGGGGAIDLVMHLYDLDFKPAVALLKGRQL